jgi:uncharacterized protein
MKSPVRNGVLFLIVLLMLLSVACSFKLVPPDPPPQLCKDSDCYSVHVRDTQEGRSQGLMFWEDLPEGYGMFFVFPTLDIHKFWMKNTLIPLDMVWMNEDYEVVHIEEEVLPCEQDPCPSYGSDEISKYVLEVNAGEAERINLGDKFILR